MSGNYPASPSATLRTKVTGTQFGTDKFAQDVNMANSMLAGVKYDYVSVAYPDTVTEVYTFKYGGSGGTTSATITIVYTDATKEFLSTVTKV